MANGVKEYKIVINGIQESVNAVESLNKQLNDLEQRINTLNSKGITVKQTGGGSALEEQDKLQKQILATEEKLAQVRDENYKTLLHMKEELKEYTQIAKSQVAAEANQQGLFDTNTMAGMKAQLKSIKQEMQTVEIGGDRFNELTSQANELNNKLKEIEQSYGQFGRNVGNYADGVAKGMQAVKVTVNGVEREFKSASGASRTLKNELRAMAVEGKRGTEEYKELQKTLAQFTSTVKDATVSSEGMNNLLHTMQSLVAIGQVTQGFSALFGFDDSEIQRSIQKLVALQNAMMGIEKISQQINERTGIGKWLASGSEMADKMAASMMGFTTATKGATVATRALGTAFKAIGIGLVVALVAELINMYKQWSDTQEKTAKEAEEAAARIKKAADDQRNAFVNASAQYMNTASRLSQLRAEYMTTNDQLKKTAIIEEASAEFKKLGINVKSVGDAQRILVNQGDAVIAMIREQGNAAAYAALRMEAFKKSFNMLMENGYDAKAAATLAGYNKDVMQFDEMLTKSNQTISKLQKQLGISNEKAIKNSNKKATKATVDGVKELNELRIASMKEGLNKTLKQLEEDRRQKIEKIRKDGVMVGELELATNQLYDKKIEEAKKKHAEEMEKIEKDMYSAILNIQQDNADKQLKLSESTYEKELDKLDEYQRQIYNLRNTSYGTQGAEYLSPDTRASLGIYRGDAELERTLKELNELNEKIYNEKDNSASIDMIEEYNQKLKEAMEKYPDFLKIQRNFDASYTGELKETFERRLDAFKDYWNKRRSVTLSNLTQITNDEKAAENARYEAEKQSENDKYNEAYKQAEKRMLMAKDEAEATIENEKELKDALELIEKEYDADWRKIFKEQTTTIETIEKQHNENLEKIDRDYYKEARKENAEYYAEMMQNMRDFQTAIYNLESKSPIMNSWGFLDIKKTRELNQKVLDSYEKLADEIRKKKIQVNRDFESGLIDKDVYESTVRELDTFVADLGEKMDAVKQKMSFNEAFSSLASEINEWMQTIGNSLAQLLSSIWEYQDANFDHMMERLDKDIDKYADLLEKQKDVTQKYADEVDSIEDELADARGDRRQHLIDQLNAEISAQRASIAEEKRMEKQKKALEAKKEKEEEDQRKREHDRQVTQAFINWHLSVANALTTQPFMPVGIAMAALATALGAAQYALVKSQKYADGGVIQGKSHKDGGVKVLGGRAEVEGGEFITNKRTTEQNIDLLEYINKKKRRVDLNDLIEFYSSGKVKKNINKMSPTRYLADGGYIPPTLNNDIDIDNRILSAIENYSKKPTVVQVVDIVDKMDNLKNVQVLAGLTPSY